LRLRLAEKDKELQKCKAELEEKNREVARLEKAIH
jgi:hypothetical protein